MKIWSLHWRDRLLWGLSITGLVMLVRLAGLLQPLEWRAFDLSLRWRPAETTDTRITIVEITEDDIQNQLNYPISDRALAELLQTLQTYQPRAIGVDIFRDRPVGEGEALLASVLQNDRNIVGINKIYSNETEGTTTVEPHPSLPEARVGFADAPLDDDGYLRRIFLGGGDSQDDYRFALTTRLVEQYLAKEALTLENGIRNPEAMRFGNVEIPRFMPNTGGYRYEDNGGYQVLINFRAGANPFDRVSYAQVVSDRIDPALLQDRIVLVGYTAESVKDFVSSAAIVSDSPSLIPGVDIQAHAVGQILSAFYEDRAFIRSLPEGFEYVLIFGGGLIGLLLSLWRQHPALHLILTIVISSFWLAICYGVIIASWWLPLVPVLMAFGLNALCLYPLYQAQAQIAAQIEERKNLINWTYNTIHNGPLQILAGVLSDWPVGEPPPPETRAELETLNKELRDIYEAMRQEMLLTQEKLVMSGQRTIDLEVPLDALLYETYQSTLERRLDFFGSVVQITSFEPMSDKELTPQQKRELARFLEEALINVCKHAKAATRLYVYCKYEAGHNVIRVVDNGQKLETDGHQESVLAVKQTTQKAYGTQQARRLARQLGGRFKRVRVQPHGIRCELSWPVHSGMLARLFSNASA